MRPIDADELKKTFAEYGEKAKFTQGFCQKLIDNAPTVEPETKVVANVTFDKEQMEELVEKAKADILEQIERPQGEWIPVSERLPVKNGFYITTCQDICESRVHSVSYDAKNKEWGRGGVLAWMPLPEPYKKPEQLGGES